MHVHLWREDPTTVLCSKARSRQVALRRLVAPVDPAKQAANHAERHGLWVQRVGKTAPLDRYGSFSVVFLSEAVSKLPRATWIIYELPRDCCCPLEDDVYVETLRAKRMDQVVQDVAGRDSNEPQVCRVGHPVRNLKFELRNIRHVVFSEMPIRLHMERTKETTHGLNIARLHRTKKQGRCADVGCVVCSSRRPFPVIPYENMTSTAPADEHVHVALRKAAFETSTQ